ncbi:hypothetical protein ACFL67_00730 [candidate division KSB1 bacterium]
MGLNICTFTFKEDIIRINGLNCLMSLCNYNHEDSTKFFKGVKLAEDLKDDKGAALYTKGASITHSEVKTLLRLSEKFDEQFELQIALEPTTELCICFEASITGLFDKMIEHKKKYKVYSVFLQPVLKEFKEFLRELLKDEKLTTLVYLMKYSTENASLKTTKQYFYHIVSLVIFAFALSKVKGLKEQLEFTKEDTKDLLRAAFLSSVGAVSAVDRIIGLPEENREEGFKDENKVSGSMIKDKGFNSNVLDAVEFVNEYVYGVYDIVPLKEKNTWMANIVIVLHNYLLEESGLLGKKNKLHDIIDRYNVLAVQNKMNIEVVQALTLGLGMLDIFDFYQEIDNLEELCKQDCAVPYPLTGVASPTLFVCKKNVRECTYLEAGSKAVNLLQNVEGLDAGQYFRCSLITPKLKEFYDKHYKSIKSKEEPAKAS